MKDLAGGEDKIPKPFVVSPKVIPKAVEFRSSERNPDVSGSNHNGDEYRIVFSNFTTPRMTVTTDP